jgi:hypothetical protein
MLISGSVTGYLEALVARFARPSLSLWRRKLHPATDLPRGATECLAAVAASTAFFLSESEMKLGEGA